LFRFNDPAAQGGGGGRWFTSSVADGFDCAACHKDSPAVTRITVLGLQATYQPGVRYDIYVGWPATNLHTTALVEIDVGPITFSGGVVAPDSDKTADGDRFTRLYKTIASPSGGGQRAGGQRLQRRTCR
jgi:hypothetical protein